MAGGTHAHHLIALNVAFALRGRLTGPCPPLPERKALTPRGDYRYPDVLVECGAPGPRDLAADKPRVIFEVESPTNTAIDEFERLEDFQSIASVEQIVFISQTSMRARTFTRAGVLWRAETISGAEAALDLSSLDCTLPLADVYDRVDFTPAAANG